MTPNWLTKAALTFAAMAALNGCSATVAPPTKQPTATPPKQEMPAATRTQPSLNYRQQALEEITLMSQREPTIAAIIPQTDWFSDGVDGSEAFFIKEVRGRIERGHYTAGIPSQGSNSSTYVLVLGEDKNKREESLEKTLQYLPLITNLLKIDYKKPLLIIDVNPEGRGSAGFRNVSISDTRQLEHELTHTVYDYSKNENQRLGQIPSWLKEGVAVIMQSYLRGEANPVEEDRESTSKTLEDIGPLFNLTLKPSNRPEGGASNDVYSGGFLLLAEYAALAGYDNLWAALRDIHEERVAKSSLSDRIISAKDLENVTEEVKLVVKQQHETLKLIFRARVPQEKLNRFDAWYQQRIYGPAK